MYYCIVHCHELKSKPKISSLTTLAIFAKLHLLEATCEVKIQYREHT